MQQSAFIQQLKQNLQQGFNLDELHTLCADLGIDKDELPTTKTPLIEALLARLQRQQRLEDLLDLGKQTRPELDWPQSHKQRLNELKNDLGAKITEIPPDLFADVVQFIKQVEQDGITPQNQALYMTLEMFIQGHVPADKFHTVWQQQVQIHQNQPTEQDYQRLKEQLHYGEVVLFLGADLSKNCFQQLADEEDYADFDDTLPALCEYIETQGRQSLLRKFKSLYQQTPTGKDLYQLLAQIKQPLLIISSNYDDSLEQAFLTQQKPYYRITHSLDYAQAGQLLVQENTQASEVYDSEKLSNLAPLAQGFSVIYKIRGCFDQIADDLILSEQDYFRFARYVDAVIPDYISNQIKMRSLWFLGQLADNWENRLFIQAINNRRNRTGRALAVLPETNRFSQAYWKARNVDIEPLALPTFMDRIKHG